MDPTTPTPAQNPPDGPRRRGMLPRWLLPVVIGTVLVLAAITGLAIWSRNARTVNVPSVKGLDAPTARSRLLEEGLRMRRGDTRFSATVPKDHIVDQEPRPGSRLPRHSTVTVVMSAGSERFEMPDVVGLRLDEARVELRDRGLSLKVDVTESEKPRNVVLRTVPAAGAHVSSADVVRVTVSSGESSATLLVPKDLSGRTLAIDPAPVPAGKPDTTLEVARRLRALFEASGAKVVVTRAVTDSDTSDSARLARAQGAAANALVGLEVLPSGAPGRVVMSPASSKVPASVYLASVDLARSLALALEGGTGERVPTANVATDTVVVGAGTPAVRVRLGSESDRSDKADFADPEWIDRVARAMYRGIADAIAPR